MLSLVPPSFEFTYSTYYAYYCFRLGLIFLGCTGNNTKDLLPLKPEISLKAPSLTVSINTLQSSDSITTLSSTSTEAAPPVDSTQNGVISNILPSSSAIVSDLSKSALVPQQEIVSKSIDELDQKLADHIESLGKTKLKVETILQQLRDLKNGS